MRREEVAKLSGLILKNLRDKSLVTPKVAESSLLAKIELVILRNLEQEEAIHEEVKKIMEQYRAQIASGAIDSQKVYSMIKKQVAKERKFVL